MIEKGKTIIGAEGRKTAILAEKKWFHQDNAPSHNLLVSMTKIYELLLDHSLYSLAPRYFFFAPWLKVTLFENNYFAAKDVKYYLDVEEMGASLGEVYRLTRDYVEK